MPALYDPWVPAEAVVWAEASVSRRPGWGRGQGPWRLVWRGAVIHTREPYPDPALGLPPFWDPLAFEGEREAGRVLDAYRHLAFIGVL